jgi:hypothetical protein
LGEHVKVLDQVSGNDSPAGPRGRRRPPSSHVGSRTGDRRCPRIRSARNTGADDASEDIA